MSYSRSMSKPAVLPPSDLPFLFRARDLRERGIPRWRVQPWLSTGRVTRVAWGLYRVAGAPETELETLAAVARTVPEGVFCLLTALRVHEIGTQSPAQVWMALDRKAWLPDASPWRVRFVRWSRPMLHVGVEHRSVHGVTIPVTTVARTVVDCFRYRNKIGLDVGLEALEESLRDRRVEVDQLMAMARACRATTVLRPYLQSLAR